jgi:hypothetical protein
MITKASALSFLLIMAPLGHACETPTNTPDLLVTQVQNEFERNQMAINSFERIEKMLQAQGEIIELLKQKKTILDSFWSQLIELSDREDPLADKVAPFIESMDNTVLERIIIRTQSLSLEDRIQQIIDFEESSESYSEGSVNSNKEYYSDSDVSSSVESGEADPS